MISRMRKANSILEYGILLFIIMGFLAGVHHFLRKHIQARVKQEVDRKLRQPIPFLWQGSVNIKPVNRFTYDKNEYIGGDITVATEMKNKYTTLVAPTPPYIPVGSLHSQDAASSPPEQNNPKQKRRRLLQRKERYQ